jgi:hypothetical protein
MGPLLPTKLFADAIDEELHAATAWTDVDVKALALHEQFAEFAEDPPIRSRMEVLGSHELEPLLATRTEERSKVSPILSWHLLHVHIVASPWRKRRR